jgi:hypothetical protein
MSCSGVFQWLKLKFDKENKRFKQDMPLIITKLVYKGDSNVRPVFLYYH